ncbi:uncharacterized protein HaLaN_22491 [Haematococcus lacustris]|uniref:Trimethylguanosine synthase n=1 Tax=Haematococcus lacustris TaxID=44745 RepID=A0A6A0A041_HAELA|nr:uncharacterized protein HaLaN_22491 [Haematococcus lacustris]
MDLVTLHAHAEETTAVTAEALSATDTKTYRLGPLLITSVLLTDIGLQGQQPSSGQQPAGQQAGGWWSQGRAAGVHQWQAPGCGFVPCWLKEEADSGQQGAQAGWGSPPGAQPHLPASPMAAARLQPAPPWAQRQQQAAAAQGESGGAPALPNQAQGAPQGAPVGPDQAQAVQGAEGVGPGPAVRGVGRLALEPGTKAYVRTLLPRNMFKYWLQRYSLFSKLDQGVQISAKRAAMAQHNAGVYGVGHKVEVLCADFFAAAPTLVADTIFVSPPWGGPSYKCDAFQVLQPAEGMSFSIQHLLQVALGVGRHQLAAVEQGHLATALAQPAGGAKPAAAAGGGQDQVLQGVPGSPSRGVVALFLPRTTLLAELAALVPAGQVWQVERNYVNCRLKGITFYCYT